MKFINILSSFDIECEIGDYIYKTDKDGNEVVRIEKVDDTDEYEITENGVILIDTSIEKYFTDKGEWYLRRYVTFVQAVQILSCSICMKKAHVEEEPEVQMFVRDGKIYFNTGLDRQNVVKDYWYIDSIEGQIDEI